MDAQSPPLAEYFWIAGIDSLSYGRPLHRKQPEDGAQVGEDPETEDNSQKPRPATILETDPATEAGDYGDKRRSRSSVIHMGNENNPRFSVHSGKSNGMLSNRSSRTITGFSFSSKEPDVTEEPGASESSDAFDFDDALRKFAFERDQFLDELTFSAGTIIPPKPITHPRAQKIVMEDAAKLSKSVVGSIRRHISIKDLTGSKKQPPVPRPCKSNVH
jgi:hypothetical protein